MPADERDTTTAAFDPDDEAIAREVAERDASDTGERLTLEEVAVSIGVPMPDQNAAFDPDDVTGEEDVEMAPPLDGAIEPQGRQQPHASPSGSSSAATSQTGNAAWSRE